MKKILFALGLMILHLPGFGQTDVLFSNHGQNIQAFNPSVIDDNGRINLTLGGRQQWIGFPDAPEVQMLGLEHFLEDYNMGLRLTALNQKFGKEVFRRLIVAYAYRVRLAEEATLQFGLGAGFYQRLVLFSQLVYLENNEPLVRPDEQYFKPDFEFGFHAQLKDLGFGYAANHISTPARDASLSKVAIHHHAYASYLLKATENLGVNGMLSFHKQGKVSYLQASVLAETGIISAGLGWRHLDAFILQAGLKITERARIAYSYDFGIGPTAGLSSGTHEVVLRLGFDKKGGAYLSPRFMDYGN
ncbi:MAG: PorP/SprF family type IX secretion system membrane protein [Bacteroidia bacterium]|jgi:type IX secretion system PorP/SprF family membrane protein|nr:PorP/SprF family type IX secretion system membrane protein [Bacteroidia bacterium]